MSVLVVTTNGAITAKNTLQDALAMVSVVQKTLIVTTNQTLVADAAVPVNTVLFITHGATISVAAGKTLTILGPFLKPNYACFTGTGGVVLPKFGPGPTQDMTVGNILCKVITSTEVPYALDGNAKNATTAQTAISAKDATTTGTIPMMLGSASAGSYILFGRIFNDGSHIDIGFSVTHTFASGAYHVSMSNGFHQTPTVIATAGIGFGGETDCNASVTAVTSVVGGPTTFTINITRYSPTGGSGSGGVVQVDASINFIVLGY